MLLPEDYVVWDKYLDSEDAGEVGKELSSLGEFDKKNIDILPHIVVTSNAFSHFLEEDFLKDKVKHLLGTLNYERHESVTQVSSHIRNLLLKSPVPDKVYKPIHRMLDHLKADFFTLRAFYFDEKKLLSVKDFRDLKGDSVIIDNIRHVWAELYTRENLMRYTVGPHNHHNLKCVIAIIPMYKFSLTGYITHLSKNEYEIEAHSMTRYRYNKHSQKIDDAIVLPGGDKNALSVSEIKTLLDIGHTAEKLFYFHQTIYWGKYKDKILVTRIVPRVVVEQNTFNHLIEAFTIHPGITVGKLRVVNEKMHDAVEFNNEIVVLEKVDRKMMDSLRKVNGIILKDLPHPEVTQALKELGIPTVVRKGSSLLYSTGDVVSLNATTGEVKRGSMLVS